MTLYEFCEAYGVKLQLTANGHGYNVTFEDWSGWVWPELEGIAYEIDGGTTWSFGRGLTPNDSVSRFCEKIKGKLLVFRREDDPTKKRLVRAPENLVP